MKEQTKAILKEKFNKINTPWFYVLVVIIISIVIANTNFVGGAESETYVVNTPVDLKLTCTINSAVPSVSTIMNITLSYPNGTTMLNNVQATPKGNGIFNYTTTFPISGTYYVTLVCIDGTNSNSASGIYIINPTGEELTSGKSTQYILIFIFSVLIFVALLIMGITISGDNKRDEMTGYILALSNLKYLKLVCLALAYLTLVFISFFIWNISHNYLDIPFMTTVFRFISIILTVLIFPLFILFVYLGIANWVRDNKIGDFLMRGLSIK